MKIRFWCCCIVCENKFINWNIQEILEKISDISVSCLLDTNVDTSFAVIWRERERGTEREREKETERNREREIETEREREREK